MLCKPLDGRTEPTTRAGRSRCYRTYSATGSARSPGFLDMFGWEGGPGGGFGFKHGTIYDCLRKAKIKYRLYAGDDFPQVAALKGVSITEIKNFSDHFVKDLES